MDRLILEKIELSDNEFNQVNELWNKEFPKVIENKFPDLLNDATRHQHYLILEGSSVIAWGCWFEKSDESRFSLIVGSQYQGMALGSKIIHQMTKNHSDFYGWVVDDQNQHKRDGTIYQSPIDFYIKLGFTVLHNERFDSELMGCVKIKWGQK